MSQKSVLDEVPGHLSVFDRAMALQRAAATLGFEWPTVAAGWAKLEEELAELAEGIAQQNSINTAEELGDVLFALINLARQLNIEPTQALAATNDKFTRRFQQMERAAWAAGHSLVDEPLQQQLTRYQSAKASLNNT